MESPGQLSVEINTLTIIDHGHDRRGGAAGSSEYAPRLSDPARDGMLGNVHAVADLARDRYGLRVLIHPNVVGYIAFEDEIARLDADISPETAGLCLDIGQLYFSGIDISTVFIKYSSRIDCLHFTDIEPTVFRMAKSKRLGFSGACAEGLMCPIGKALSTMAQSALTWNGCTIRAGSLWNRSEIRRTQTSLSPISEPA